MTVPPERASRRGAAPGPPRGLGRPSAPPGAASGAAADRPGGGPPPEPLRAPDGRWRGRTVRRRLLAPPFFLLVSLATFGLPVALGLSWFPLPLGLERPPGPAPAYLTAADPWTFPHVDWPMRRLEATALAEGRIPWWNPYLSLGAPLAGQLANQLFSPIELIEIFLGPLGWNLVLLAKVALAGLGAYLFARRCGLAPVPSGAAGLAYGLSAYFLWFHTMPAFVNQAMLLPWLFAAATLAWDRAAGPLLPVGAVGLVVGGLLLSGQPQIAALALLGLGIAHLVGGLQARQPRAALAGWSRLGAGVLLGCGIGAIQLLLLRDVLTYAFTLHQEGGYAEPRIAALTFTVALWPYLLGQVMEPWDPALYPSRLNWEALPLTVGGAQLLLVLAGLLVALDRRARPAVPFGRVLPYVVVLALFYGIVAGSSAGIPGLWGWGPLGRINFPRYGAPVTALMLALLAGWAVAAAGAVRRRHLIGANVGLALLALLAAWAVAPAFLAPSDRVDPAYRAWSVPLGLAPFALGAAGANLALGLLLAGRTTLGRAQVALVVCLGAELASFLRYGLPLEREAARLGVPGLLVAGAVLVLAGRARAAGVAAALALGLQAVVVAASPARLAAVFDPFAFEPPHITFLRERLGPGSAGGRILGTALHVQSNASSAFGVAELTGLQPVQAEGTSIYVREVLGDRHVSFVTPVGWGGMAPEGTDPFAWPSYPAHRAAYNAIAVRYLVAPPGGWLAQHRPEGVEPVYADGAAVVYEDVLALPRAFTVDRAAPAAGITDAVRQLRAPGADPRRRVVVEAPPDALPEALRRDGDADVRPATILRHAPEAVDVLVEAEGPRLLVLADAAYPRWSAAIDGAPARILRVNAAVRGVVVPPGRHVVEFRYAQLRADLALAASLACGAGAPVLVALGLARRRGRSAR